MSRREERQRLIRRYKDVTGEQILDMRKVAEFAKSIGWRMPTPPSEIDILTQQFADDAQAERRFDPATQHQYRGYQALPVGQLAMWVYVDIDDANREQMLRAAHRRRSAMIADGCQLTFDLDYWNHKNTDEVPITMSMDLSPDIAAHRKNNG